MSHHEDHTSSGPSDATADGPDVDAPTNDEEGSEKPGGLGQDGTIPDEPGGVAAGHTGEPSTFEPEEDEGAS